MIQETTLGVIYEEISEKLTAQSVMNKMMSSSVEHNANGDTADFARTESDINRLERDLPMEKWLKVAPYVSL